MTEQEKQSDVEMDSDLDIDPVTTLENVDLNLPGDYETDIMAEELLAHLTTYHRVKAALKSARSTGDNKRAEELYKNMSFSRMAAAVIQRDCPSAKAVADEMAACRALNATNQRKVIQGID